MTRNIYTPSELIKNLVSLIYTKIFFKKARLIRIPFYIRGRKYFDYGEGITTGYRCRFEMFDISSSQQKKLKIGNNLKVGDNVHIASGESVQIGNDCLFASNVYISDISHGDYSNSKGASSPLESPDKRRLTTKPVIIGDNVWLGENVSILPGVRIGNGTIIGANAVVNKNIPESSIAVGVPAKIVKIYSEEKGFWERC